MQSTRPPIHIWQDNETENDLLGFDVHADLIRAVITDQSVLPVTVGVFGDWGGGKSSIMKMLQKALSNDQEFPDVVCLYFNGWTFEGYEDAKSALLISILIQLGEHKKFGPKAKDWDRKAAQAREMDGIGKSRSENRRRSSRRCSNDWRYRCGAGGGRGGWEVR